MAAAPPAAARGAAAEERRERKRAARQALVRRLRPSALLALLMATLALMYIVAGLPHEHDAVGNAVTGYFALCAFLVQGVLRPEGRE